jgi:DNA-directed RNA polymerase subunit RPC12/RpoP
MRDLKEEPAVDTVTLKNTPKIKYVCDSCNKEFMGKDIILVDPLIGDVKPFTPMAFVDKRGKLRCGQPWSELGDRVLACPHCEHIHLYGFDPAYNQEGLEEDK